LIPLLIKFIFSESPFTDTRDDLFSSKLITAGYDSGIAKICVMSRWSFQTYRRKYVYTVDGLTRFGEGKEYDSNFCFNHTTKEVGKLIEQEIINYAMVQNRTDYIGVPIMVVKIDSRNKISWIRNENGGKNYKDNKNLYTVYVNGKIKIHFKAIDGEKYFLKHQ